MRVLAALVGVFVLIINKGVEARGLKGVAPGKPGHSENAILVEMAYAPDTDDLNKTVFDPPLLVFGQVVGRRHKANCEVAVVIRERDGKVLPAAFPSGGAALRFIQDRVAKETEIMADASRAWNALQRRYVMKRINHQLAYSQDGACTNGAESFFNRLLRAEAGHHHHIAGVYLPLRVRKRMARGSPPD
jgi:hypothetical protein